MAKLGFGFASAVFLFGTVANAVTPQAAKPRPHVRVPAAETPSDDRGMDERLAVPAAAHKPPEKPPEEFNPYIYNYSVGLEGPALTGTSILKETAVAFGLWVDRSLGMEFYLGYTRSADTATTTTTNVANAFATTRTLTTASTGTGATSQVILGGALKYRIHQRKHFGVSADFIFSINPGATVTYATGTHVETTPDTSDPTTYNVTDTALGNVNVGLSPSFRVGPRLTVDYHLPWLPNLLFGATFGVFTSIGGSTTTTTTVRTQTYAVTGGVAAAPTADTTTTTTAVLAPGTQSSTYGLGGSGFTIGTGSGLSPVVMIGTFRIRYAF